MMALIITGDKTTKHIWGFNYSPLNAERHVFVLCDDDAPMET